MNTENIPKILIEENMEKAFHLAKVNGIRPGKIIREKQIKDLRITYNNIRGSELEESFRDSLLTLQPELVDLDSTTNVINEMSGVRISTTISNRWLAGFHDKQSQNDKKSYLLVGLIIAGENENFIYRQRAIKRKYVYEKV